MAEVKRLVEERHGAIDVLKTWLPRVALAMVFVSVGALKFAAHSVYVRIFDEIGLGQWFRFLTGVVEVGGGVLLLMPGAAAVGFILLGCTMAGAVAFWNFTHHTLAAIIPGALLLAVTGFGWAEVTRFVGNMRRSPGFR
jgi:putative oxidoreductase